MPAFLLLVLAAAAAAPAPRQDDPPCEYLDYRTPTPGGVQAAGIQFIPLREGYKVWTKRFGNSPMKVLLLHGGPAATHEYLECFESFFPQANIQFYHYDQLGSYYSDQPDDMSLWTIDRFVEEVEQVRVALGLDASNFYLLGNSWGGMLAMEYALKYQRNLKGLIVCNMTADFGRYEQYNAMLRAQLPADVLARLEEYEARGDYHDPEYLQLVMDAYYRKHICQAVYEHMQGPSEFVPGGILKGWSVWDRLGEIEVPTLMVGAKYDTMNPAEMTEMAALVKNGRSLYCPNGSHMCMWDDQQVFMDGVIEFIHDVHAGRSP
jgi:proline iminopeptidase